ncbi:MAG: hypothetical protein MHM6MM_004546 [Cercozoa sp. M6MM]
MNRSTFLQFGDVIPASSCAFAHRVFPEPCQRGKVEIQLSQPTMHSLVRVTQIGKDREGADAVKAALLKAVPGALYHDNAEERAQFKSNEHSSDQWRQFEVATLRQRHQIGTELCTKAELESLQLYHAPTLQIAEFHSRLQRLLPFFIESANFVAPAVRWSLAWLVRITDTPTRRKEELVAFATFYHFPIVSQHDNNQLELMRLSQILVLPPFRGRAYGRLLLQWAQHHVHSGHLRESRPGQCTPVLLSVESPNCAMQTTRDIEGLHCALVLNAFGVQTLEQEADKPHSKVVFRADMWNDQMARKAQCTMRVPLTQVRRIFELLCHREVCLQMSRDLERVEKLATSFRKFVKVRTRLAPVVWQATRDTSS